MRATHALLLGSVVEIRADEPVAAAVAVLFEACDAEPSVVVTAENRDGAWTVTGPQGSLPARSHGQALELVLSQVNAAALGGCAGFAVHAGVVARDGQALALPAQSGAGKSTLVASLLGEGWQYVSDEALVSDWESGGLDAYPKPLTLLAWTLHRLGLDPPPAGRAERSLRVAELGATVAAGPLRLAHVVLPRRAGAGPATLEALHRSEAAMALLTHSFNHFTDPVGALRTAAGLARGAQAWTLDYDDPVEAAQLLGTLHVSRT